MPGLTVCFRCGSLLENADVAVEVHPPRAAKWKKPFRRIHRWLRRRTALSTIEIAAERAVSRANMVADDGLRLFGIARRDRRLSPWPDVRILLTETFGGLLLSVLPGLVQLIQQRFKSVRILWLSWFSSLAMGLFFVGRGSLGAISLGMALVLHAWIAADAALLLERLKGMVLRLAAVGVAAVWVFVVYWGVRVTVLGGIIGGEALVDVPHYRVTTNDYLLCRRLKEGAPSLRRGDLVALSVPSGTGVGQVVALPGEIVKVEKDRFTVNRRELDPAEFKVPRWLRKQKVSLPLGREEYFVRMGYNVELRGRYQLEELVRRTLVVKRSAIRGRAFMRWMPVRRRGFLKENE